MEENVAGKRFRPTLTPDGAREAADREVEHHLAELVDRLVEQGLEPSEARREAERRFGDVDAYRRRLRRIRLARRGFVPRVELLDLLATALRATVRTARRQPGFALAVVLTLALGVGANAVMFGVLDRLLLRPPDHVVDHERVVRVMVERPFLGRTVRTSTVAWLDIADLHAHSALTGVAAYTGVGERTVGSGAEASRVRVARAGHGLFALLGVRPALGRFYGEDEDGPGAPPTAVVSHEYWRRALGGHAGALGTTLSIGGTGFQVVGVAPPGFTGVDLSPVDVWLPIETVASLASDGADWLGSRDNYWVRAVARLAPDATAAAAAEEATVLHRNGRRASVEAGNYQPEARIALDPLIAARGPEASAESRVARWLGGVSLLVLVLACANVANLLLANGARRRREVALRLALGVPPRRLVGVMVLESVLLALAGGAVALLLAALGGGVVRDALLPGVLFPGPPVGGRAVGFALAVAALAGVVAGLGPALQASRAELSEALAAGGRGGSARGGPARVLLSAGQAAISAILLVGAGLFVRSVAEVRALDLGLDVDRLLLVVLEFEGGNLASGLTVGGLPPATEALVRNEVYLAAIERLGAVPKVEAVAGTSSPFQFAFATDLRVPGRDSIPRLPGGGPYFHDVTPGYFDAVGLRLLGGRSLEASDGAGSEPVTVVSETMARTLWPDGGAVGGTILVGGEDDATAFTVVGVVEDASRGSLREEPHMAYYLPLAQREGRRTDALYVRVAGDPSRMVEPVAAALRSLDPRVRWAGVSPLRERLDPQTRSWRLGATMFTVFGLLALAVAAVGLYGVLAFEVAQRTRELGIRAALGADGRRLLGGVVGRGVGMTLAGVGVGLLIAFLAGPRLQDLLFEVRARDPTILVGAAAALLLVALAASWVPGVRATRVDPLEALRAD